MKYKIGVFGSGIEDKKASKIAKKLGQDLAKIKNIIIITGAGPGLPSMVANEASNYGLTIWGFTPEINIKRHNETYREKNLPNFSKLFFVPADYRKLFFKKNKDRFEHEDFARKNYRNVISTANCDAGIIISGRWGTLNEFINLYEMGKVIGVLTKTGGIADQINTLITKIPKKSTAIVIFENDPKILITKVIEALER